MRILALKILGEQADVSASIRFEHFPNEAASVVWQISIENLLWELLQEALHAAGASLDCSDIQEKITELVPTQAFLQLLPTIRIVLLFMLVDRTNHLGLEDVLRRKR